MAAISFYALASNSRSARQNFACKLIEKIYRSGQACYVLIDSREEAVELDQLLWSFRPGSFIPHQIYAGIVPEFPQTILIGGADIPENRQKVIINLSNTLPALSENTERVLEILDNSESCRHAGRQRYRHYQQLGLMIVTHKI